MAKWKQQATSQSRFFCTQCGTEGLPIFRKKAKLREPGHLKKLYCFNCKKEVNHAEVREIGGYTYEDFLEEFNDGRFLEDGTRPSTGQLWVCSKEDCPFNKDGRCWNENNSINCPHKPKESE